MEAMKEFKDLVGKGLDQVGKGLDTVQKDTKSVNAKQGWRNRREERRERHGWKGEEPKGDELDMSKYKIVSFLGNCKLEVYVDWEPKFVRLVTLDFCDYALVWWTQMFEDIKRGIKDLCEDWVALKKMMIDRLYQGFRNVEEYKKKMEIDLMRAQIKESEEAIIAWFLHGLNREIQDVVDLQHYSTLDELVHQNIKVKMKIRRRSVSRKAYKGEITTTPTPNAPRTSSIKCFKCLGKDHIASQCPNRTTMILRDNGEVESESSHREQSFSTDVETSNDESNYEEDLLMVRRLMSSQISDVAKTQRENIFHSRCLILGNLCSMIIDCGSYVNVATQRLVRKLDLPTFAHPWPYKLQWLSDKGELLVDKKVEVATHLFLGRSWQFYKEVIHDGVTNKFTFIHLAKRIVLKPLSLRK
ncbi:hypothetical protein CR513_01068, partial [Mucuna pruriens]